MQPMPALVALADQLAAIKARSPDYWRDFVAEAAALLGGGANEHGVFMHGQDELVAKHRNSKAEITVAETPYGLFAVGINFYSSACGFGYAPNIWSEPYATREHARRAGIEEILAYLDEPHGGKAAAEEIKQVRKQLEAQLLPKQQMLFV